MPFKLLLSRTRSDYSNFLVHHTGHAAAQQPEVWSGPRQRLLHPCHTLVPSLLYALCRSLHCSVSSGPEIWWAT